MAKPNKSAGAGSARKKQYSAPALEKGLDILELLADEPGGLNLTEITQRLGRSVGELFRMLVVLEQRGYVSMVEGTDTYVLTLKMFDLSHRFPPVKRLTSTATPVMRKLAYTIGQSCHLTVCYEGKGHIVVQQDAPSARIFSVRLGAEVPLSGSCSGHVLLAFADEQERALMLGQIPRGHEKPSRDEIKRLLNEVKPQGFEKITSRQIEGVQDIGYPVFDYTGRLAAALVVPFLAFLDGSHPVDIKMAQQKMRDAAEKISDSLGI